MQDVKKVLLLGSGALKIGQAGEFDYSGSQAIKALKEEGVEVVLINPNIATVQTSEGMAEKIYFLPVTPYFVKKVIEKEKPDGILLSFGGQTALNCGVELSKKGILSKNKVRVLGTPVKTIEDTEDRELFVGKLKEVNVHTPKSKAATSIDEAIQIAKEIGFPVMIRSAFTLGGKGSGSAKDEKELLKMLQMAFSYAPQVLVEEYLGGWKEVEYEVVRDSFDNCITVCNMENFDPMGIHTGESIVVAPSQTLTNDEYHMLREVSIRVIRHLGIVGECNIQFALNPKNEEYRVIEVNARLSRSSALASKATGYPLAFVAAKLALGYSLVEVRNSITQTTTACFEPALDYVVLKIPRWDLSKFKAVSQHIGTEMKSVGEVMSIGRTFEEVLQKALRMLQVGVYGVVCNDMKFKDLIDSVKNPTDKRVFAVAEAMKQNITAQKIHDLSGIDTWFLYKIKNIVDMEKKLKSSKMTKELMLNAKKLGFSDYQIGIILGKKELEIRALRKNLEVFPSVKQIDTLGAEYPAKTNYLYMTYSGSEHDIEYSNEKTNKSVVVLGSGAYRIGSSVEFDWCCVNAVLAAKKLGYSTIMINYNPETVSTDYDTCDKLYFDELSLERVLDIYDLENPHGIIISMGGQIPNNLAMPLHNAGAKILGTSPLNIDNAENRHKFSSLLDELKIDQPYWKELTTLAEAKKFAKKVGYPVLIRPSYVLSGAAMNVVFSEENLVSYLDAASDVSKEHPVVISKFITGAKEIEIDAVANNGEMLIYAISEHIENAGVHSGDANMALPPQKTYLVTTRQIKKVAKKLAKALQITGPFNIQFLARENHLKVIECNLRSSRSFPFVSKVFKKNFIDIATRAILGEEIPKINRSSLDLDYVGVKAPQFSYSRLKGADPMTHVEMASTGEVACIGYDIHEAFLKSVLSTGMKFPKKSVLISISGEENRYKLLNHIRKLNEMNFTMYATEHTAEFYERWGIATNLLYKIHENKKPNVKDFLVNRKIDLIISMPGSYADIGKGDTYTIRRSAVDYSIPLINNIQVAQLFIDAISSKTPADLEIKAWHEY
jgi:carbamoyl-phosphate synthase large subunit